MRSPFTAATACSERVRKKLHKISMVSPELADHFGQITAGKGAGWVHCQTYYLHCPQSVTMYPERWHSGLVVVLHCPFMQHLTINGRSASTSEPVIRKAPSTTINNKIFFILIPPLIMDMRLRCTSILGGFLCL